MKIEEDTSGTDDRTILLAMITDKTVCNRVASKWTDGGLFSSKWANLVGSWCVRHCQKYGDAPGKHVESIFHGWSNRSQRNPDTVSLIERFLGSLSSEYESTDGINSEFVLDLASRHFNQVRLLRLSDSIREAVENGDGEEAENAVLQFGRVELAAGDGIDLFHDTAALQAALEERQESIVQYPGALNEFFGDSLGRDCFVAFMAPDKSQKSFWLLDIAYRAALQRRKVVYFECGDMSQAQVIRRFLSRITKNPVRPGTVLYPRKLTHEEGKPCAQVLHKEKHFDKGLDWKIGQAACERLIQETLKTDKTLFRLFSFPNSTINVQGIKGHLDNLVRQGWCPDVVVLDYADILAAPTGTSAEERDQINTTWKQLRAMSQQYHCLTVTATQANAASYDAQKLTRSNFSGDKRKLAHVTGMVGINITAEERENGQARLNWIVRREAAYTDNRFVHVASCPALGNPCVLSTF